jgi:Oxidoreductase molybdopterin binding domain
VWSWLPSGVAGRRTNLGLLVLLPLAVLTGFGAFLVGSGPALLVVGLHAVVGLAILLLLPWKSMIARRGLRRPRPGQVTSIALAVLVVLTLLTGLAHSTGLLVDVGGYGVLLIHVGAGLLAIVPAVSHVRRRRVRPRVTDVSRRTLLRGGLLSAAAVGVYFAAAGAVRALSLPGGRRRETGSYELSSGTAAGVPTTSWMFDAVPDSDPGAWRLAVLFGDEERTWTVNALNALAGRVTAVLDCTGGWWTEQTWSGARVAQLLPPGASGTVTVISATGYRRRLPLTDNLLLATGFAGTPLTPGHGAPLRLVVPGRRGYHWVKWVVRIEHDERPWWWQLPLPLQ